MNTRTLTALYQSRADAEAAAGRLRAANLGSDIDIHDDATASTTIGSAGAAAANAGEGFMGKMKSLFGGHEDTHTYAEGVRRGHFLLTAKVDEFRATEAAELLDASDAVDLDRTEQSWKSEGWAAPTAGYATGYDASAATGGSIVADASVGSEQAIPIVEERLVVGKREVERGGVRVRSYVVEEPVSESVNLREEHVSVERRAVDRAVGVGDADFRDREIALTETAEEAVVAKDAFVREELVVRKEASERTEEIHDTVRHTEVEVEDTTSRTRETDLGTSRPV